MNLSTHARCTICSTPYPNKIGILIVMIVLVNLCGRGGTLWWHRNLEHLLCCIIVIFVRSGTTSMCCYLMSTVFKLNSVSKESACLVVTEWVISLYTQFSYHFPWENTIGMSSTIVALRINM